MEALLLLLHFSSDEALSLSMLFYVNSLVAFWVFFFLCLRVVVVVGLVVLGDRGKFFFVSCVVHVRRRP